MAKVITVEFEQGDKVWLVHENKVMQGTVRELHIECKYSGYSSSGWGSSPSFPIIIQYGVSFASSQAVQTDRIVYQSYLYKTREDLAQAILDGKKTAP